MTETARMLMMQHLRVQLAEMGRALELVEEAYGRLLDVMYDLEREGKS